MGRVLMHQAAAATMELFTIELPGIIVDVFQQPDELIALLQGGNRADVVVLSPELENPIQLAEQILGAVHDTEVVVITHLEHVEEASPPSPFLRKQPVFVGIDERQELVRMIRDMVAEAERRRRYQELVDTIQPEVVTLAPPLPPPTNLLGSLLDHAPVGVIVVDPDEHVVDWNRQAEATLGWDGRLKIGTSISSMFPASQRQILDAFLQRCRRGEVVEPHVFFSGHPDGHSRFVEVSATTVPGRDLRRFTMLILHDITEHKHAEERFRLVVEAAPSAMLMADKRGAITLVNTQTEQLFGYTRDELLGASVEMLVPERFRAAHPSHRVGYLREPTTRAMGAGRDLYGLRKDGSEVPIEIGLNPIRTDGDLSVLASIIDITERIQTAQRLTTSIREKELLLKEIHHRVKNNLAVIGSLFYLQSTTTSDEDTLRILKDCQDRVRSIALVHERLYRSDDLANVDFAEYTDELAHQLLRNYALSSETIALTFRLETTPLGIDQAIPCGLILTELISNALKHAFPNGRTGEILVSLHRTERGGLVISVVDDGIGLPQDANAKESHSLGMRLVHSLAHQLNATIEFFDRSPGTEARLSLEVLHVHPS